MADAIVEIVGQDDLPTIVDLYNRIYRPVRDIAAFRRRFLGRHNVLQMIEAQRTLLVGIQIPTGVSSQSHAALQQAINEAFVTSFRVAMLIASGLALASALSALLLIEGKK